jgi:hypothetical protein
VPIAKLMPSPNDHVRSAPLAGSVMRRLVLRAKALGWKGWLSVVFGLGALACLIDGEWRTARLGALLICLSMTFFAARFHRSG